MKKLLGLLFTLAALTMPAAEVTRNTTLSDGQQLYASDLHNLIDTATIGSAFYTDQTTATSVGTGNYFLLLDPATGLYRKVTAQNVLYGNTNLFLNLSLLGRATDYGQVVWYNPTNNTLYRVASSNLVAANFTNILVAIAGAQFGTNLPLSSLPGILGTNLMTHYLYQQTFEPWTVLGTNSTGFTNSWANTNFAITGLYQFGNTNNVTLAAADTMPINSTAQRTNTVASLDALFLYYSNRLNIPTFTSTNITLMRKGTNIAVPHGLSSTPGFVRVVMVCVTSDAGSKYVPGDEVPYSLFSTASGSLSHAFGISCNSSNVNIARNGAATIYAMEKGDGSTYTAITSTNNFRLKIYAGP